ncbi:MAG TPA: dienelactone hydrolase family protein, partial [Polyangium sp.]|nr:dienelactone hydrolase family protein [Polyangium sp.]
MLSRLRRSILIGLASIAIASCGGTTAPVKSEPDKPATSSTVAQGMTGGLSEEEFKALHTLKTDT